MERSRPGDKRIPRRHNVQTTNIKHVRLEARDAHRAAIASSWVAARVALRASASNIMGEAASALPMILLPALLSVLLPLLMLVLQLLLLLLPSEAVVVAAAVVVVVRLSS